MRIDVDRDRFIAIVDDDESVREAAVGLLRSMPLPAIAFPSAEAFLSSGCVGSTACLVLDVQMPDMNGLTLQRYLETTGRRIPILFVTAYADDAVRAKALRAGVVGFLLKPFSERDRLDGLRDALAPADRAWSPHPGVP